MLKLLKLLGVFKLFKFLTAGSAQNEAAATGDVEAPSESSGIALANMATNQTPVVGAPARRTEGQSEMPSQSQGLASANNSSDAVLPRLPGGTRKVAEREPSQKGLSSHTRSAPGSVDPQRATGNFPASEMGQVRRNARARARVCFTSSAPNCLK